MAYSGTLIPSSRKFTIGPSIAVSMRPVWDAFLASLRRVNDRRRQRRAEAEIRTMSEQQLRDIGLDPRRIGFITPGYSLEATNENIEHRNPSVLQSGELHVA